MSRSYILLLLKSGFTKDDVQLISAPGHALVGIKLYNQWYFVECTNSNPESFAMTYQNEWYNGTPEGQYDGYIIPGTYSYYCDADGTRVVSQESEAYLAQCYKSNYNRGDVNMDGVTKYPNTSTSTYSDLSSILFSLFIMLSFHNVNLKTCSRLYYPAIYLFDHICKSEFP